MPFIENQCGMALVRSWAHIGTMALAAEKGWQKPKGSTPQPLWQAMVSCTERLL
jgi:hypothetical protein